MEFSFYRNIKGKLKKRGLPFNKARPQEDVTCQLFNLARQLDENKLNTELCQLAIAECQANLSSGEVGDFLSAARTLSKPQSEDGVLHENHIRLIAWIYGEALVVCDRSLIRPIRLELGNFYQSHGMFSEAAECYKQSMCINLSVYNLLLAKRYDSALDELKNFPSHLMTSREYTSMFLLQLLLGENLDELRRSSLQHLESISRTPTIRGLIPIDDHLFDLTGLLESLLMIIRRDKEFFTVDGQQDDVCAKNEEIKTLIVNRLCAFLNPTQVQLLDMITSGTPPPKDNET